MSTPNHQKPSIAWLVAFFAAAIISAWDMYAKPGGWTEAAVTACVFTFMFGSAIWHLVRALKADRAKQLAERARLKAFNDENRARGSTEDQSDTPAE
jgi:hypothetical protein